MSHIIHTYKGLSHPPHLSRLTSATHTQALVEPLSIPVDNDSFVPGFLHLPPASSPTVPSPKTAAILLSGAGGGVTGPSSIYTSLACKLAVLPGLGIPALRLDYRFPSRTGPCVKDVLAAMEYLETNHGAEKFLLVGWSFGGSVVLTVAGDTEEGREKVVGCATVASQTAGTGGMARLAPRPVLLLHGTGDKVLSWRCSEMLYEMYGEGEGSRKVVWFEGDDHGLRGNAEQAEAVLLEFVTACAGARMGDEAKVRLVDDGEREELMRRGGDLRSPERLE